MDSIRQKLEEILRTQKTCVKAQLAVLIETQDSVYIRGWNGSPTCVINGQCMKKEIPADPLAELCHPIHAEVRAICQAAKEGISVKGATIYMSQWFPCAACAEAIIESGITKLVTPDEIYSDAKNFVLAPKLIGNRLYFFEIAEKLLRESGIKIIIDPEIRPGGI